ncbi:HK97 family phage prohead protease [Aureimonas sp. AU12]|uniref:HK97 family phage prohead protease n=1 Tax=Aureimonas sp. AU12 TaxID=1638161 RepID=UPI00078259AD|nr:HK97 family phage prohead protease [Aureimonas sp. AU12]
MNRVPDVKRTVRPVGDLDPPGTVRGYASLFGRTDLSGDRIAPGAFARTLAERGAAGVRMLWQHDPGQPIGVWTGIAEDRHGLYAEGRIALDSAGGRNAFALLTAKAIDGLSIGFRTRRSQAIRERGARRLLLDIDLWEISVVTFPMQEAARVAETRARPLEFLDRIAEATRRIARSTPRFGV